MRKLLILLFVLVFVENALALDTKVKADVQTAMKEYINDVIRAGLERLGSSRPLRIRVSAQDFEFIEVVGIAKSMKEYDGTWAFVADESINAGCIVETSAGEIDFQLDEAWERIKQNVVSIMK